ncbi:MULTISPECIES: DUF4169 family protein [unclassified Sphingomonas]|uniref:DUF4169 family protein n=1 Tax=unclassified Sphingomonas TaxID=196159 RepID=UPI000928A0A4|nr:MULTISPECIES: DUF4169 family protein [unclassified Sphingomonas]MBN8848721.1 DUF4169 family protein [Sphingomonas sp.]OJV33413.1 MAG: DUF4169 domain-containing protein [Sphingomonas sp. 67-36]
MGVVNLRLARKAKRRATEETTAAANRAAFGRTKGEKLADRAERERAERALDGAKLGD